MRLNEAIRPIAERQLHLVARRQALAAGASDDQIRHGVRTGLLVALHAGVYLTLGRTPSNEQRVLAACLACGDDAYGSHGTAAMLWGLRDDDGSCVQVTVPPERCPRVPGVRVHRRRLRRAVDRTERGDAIPLTTPARTLLDLASVLSYDDLEYACDEAFRRFLITPLRLFDYLKHESLRRSRGIASLRVIADDRLRCGTPESVLETDAVRPLRSYGLPEPTRQFRTRLSGRNVRFDLAWVESRVAIELDGRAPHWGRRAW